MLLRQKQNMSKEADDCFTHKEMQLLKSEIFEKTNHINAFTVLNVHIFLSEKEESDNKQKEVVIFEFSSINSHASQKRKVKPVEKDQDRCSHDA